MVTRRSTHERIALEKVKLDKLLQRQDQLRLKEAQRIQKIAEGMGLYEHAAPDALIEKALTQVIAWSAENAPPPPPSDRRARELRVIHQTNAQLERVQRTLKRLSTESRRKETSQKWQLGNLLDLAGRRSVDLDALDQQLAQIVIDAKDADIAERWKKNGSAFFEKQQSEVKKNRSGNNASSEFVTDKAASHRKITLGGLIKKHNLDTLSPALLLGALLESSD